MTVRVKICGLTDRGSVEAAVRAGASYIGLVFFPRSPRSVNVETAAVLARIVPAGVTKVALMVDPDDEGLDAVTSAVPLDMIQLHGDETPERAVAVRARAGLPVMKAVGLETEADLERIDRYAEVADQMLVDAKPPRGAVLPGGNGVGFDWRLIAGRSWSVPWMLAGGLTPENAAEAIRLTGASQLDVSSGVEEAPGRKDPARIAAFCRAAGADRAGPA